MSTTNIGLYLSNSSNKNYILEQILKNHFLQKYVDLSALNGVLHSTITINKFVEEELRHDRYLVTTKENSSMGSMSSGQQKKALLTYLIGQNPDYIVLDDVYSNIDKETQESITITLGELSKSIMLIQIFFRKRDVLPFIDLIFSVDNNNNIVNQDDAKTFCSSKSVKESSEFNFSLPQEYDQKHIDIDPLIQLNNVSVSYVEKPVLDNINWTIKKGEFWQLVGPNGSGKSTLLSVIIGDNPRGYGQDMILFGRKKGSGESIWDIKRQIGYFTPSMILQFNRDDTVENMIVSGLVDSVGLYNKPSDMQIDIAKKWVKMLGDNFKNKSFQSLSIGQQRMVMVARAMVKHPPLLILDEPTIELDDDNSRLFIEMVNTIAAEKKIAILYVSHRDEPDLKPEKIYQLLPDKNGSKGIII